MKKHKFEVWQVSEKNYGCGLHFARPKGKSTRQELFDRAMWSLLLLGTFRRPTALLWLLVTTQN